MKEKKESTICFEIRLWEPNKFKIDITRKDKVNIFNGMLRVKNHHITTIPFHSAGQLLTLIENNYIKIGKEVKKNEIKM